MGRSILSITDLVKNRDDIIPPEKLSGIYRAIVKDIKDDQDRARVRVLIPAIHDTAESVKNLPWADCCSIVAGPDRSIVRIPDVDDVVYVMFEQGDREYPVWMGSWWGKGDLPSEIIKGKEKDHLVIKVGEGMSIDISQEIGKKYISIKTANDSEIKIDETGDEITITGGSPTTKINIVPGSTSQIDMGNLPFTPCNDFPQCLFTGAPHYIGTNLPGNKIMVP